MYAPPNYPLRRDMVQYVGDYVAFVVAESHVQARDAAELVEIDYEALPSVRRQQTFSRKVRQKCGTERRTMSVLFKEGNLEAVDASLASAHHVTSLSWTLPV